MRFFRFWWDFIVGDDWRVAAGIAIAIGIAAALVAAGVPAWWFLPLAVAAVLYASLWRETQRSWDVPDASLRPPGRRAQCRSTGPEGTGS
ncbi:MAG: hypothetical protein E6G08_05645 [Actinobacteria bacterium]|nr:MAG: hypothetical protein E6G08_05645 [Actinomycetota bacterium]